MIEDAALAKKSAPRRSSIWELEPAHLHNLSDAPIVTAWGRADFLKDRSKSAAAEVPHAVSGTVGGPRASHGYYDTGLCGLT
jgi:hypothetical protein